YADTRSLAVTRIAFSLLIIIDLLIRSTFLEAHYTDNGIMPIEALVKYSWKAGYFSLHILSGEFSYQVVLFVLNAIFAIFLLLGFKTRFSTIVCTIFMISLHNRNPFLLQGGDTVFRCLMFWAIFMPWGLRFSVDSYLKSDKKEESKKIFSIGALAFMLQIAFIYYFTAVHKYAPEWKVKYTAIYYALSLDQFRYFLGNYLYKFPDLMKVLTFCIWWIEYLVAFILFFPLKNSYFRVIGILLISLFHIGLIFTMRLGLFPWISIASMLIFIPSLLWLINPNIERRLDLIFLYISKYFRKFSVLKFDYIKLNWLANLKYLEIILVVFLLIYVFWWNLKDIRKYSIKMPKQLYKITEVTRLDQKWKMFAPYPLKSSSWMVLAGTDKDGKAIDLFDGGDILSWEKPESFYNYYKIYRIRKLARNLTRTRNRGYLKYYSRYLCDKWNSDKSNKSITKVEIFLMSEKNIPNYNKMSINKKQLYQYICF
ncbi:MAG: HTTM domain-containing protein, partial [Candidatus Dadabacteria bacterium]|nr:HTTM domain-containing protein [Candidatus Dadabacteria bacterium]NIQ14941.1 HTTM domain-containing protein [Candidatus Dadabacteria bacterium]